MKRILMCFIALISLGSAFALESNEEITVVQGLQEDENFSTLVGLLESSGLAEELTNAGGITLFAPTNEAFDNLGSERLTSLSSDTAALASVLRLHVLQGAYTVLDLNNAEEGSLITLADEPYTIAQSASGLTVNGVNLVSTDVDNVYADGIVHVVSEVILPADMIGGDTNGDGVVDNNDITDTPAEATALTDSNGDGVIDSNDVTDSNGDGVIDEQDFIAAGVTDSNGDGVIDALDITSSDVTVDDQTTMSLTDTNGDGVVDGNDVTDVNADGTVDEQDFLALGLTDMNGDGVVDGSDITDTNGDGVIDASDMSATMTEDAAAEDNTTVTVITDSDNDGQNNCEDVDDGIDSDGDGTDEDQCRAS